LNQGPLVLTNSRDQTADFVIGKLAERQLPYCRLNVDQLAESVTMNATEKASAIVLDGQAIHVETLCGIWLRHPHGFVVPQSPDTAGDIHTHREWSAAIEGILARVPMECWINHPAANVRASYKIEQLSRARAAGFCVPETIVTQSYDVARAFFRRHNGAIVVKSLSGGYIEREESCQDTVVHTHAVSEQALSEFPRERACPTLFQRRINKQHDVRVVVIDDDIHAVALKQSTETVDVRENNFVDVIHEFVTLPSSIRSQILKYVRAYQLRFAALDMILDRDGRWVFLEINPNGEWAWLEGDRPAKITESLISSLYSCSDV
jgi:hypothetical protein